MIVVLALDRSDGWVFAKDEDKAGILLLRPPYRLHEARMVSETIVARSVTHHGYAACERELPSWTDVITFVRGEVAQQRKAEGGTLPEEGVGRALLRSAPTSTVERFLERIRGELVSQDLDAAERILLAIQIESPRLRESSDLARRTAQLLADVLKKKEERQRGREQLVRADENERFPRLARSGHLGQIRTHGQRVARAGSMFVP